MYVQDRDLISLHYDHAPDRDDGHATVAALAVVRMLGIQPHVVSGAYGAGNRTRYVPAAEQVMRQAWGTDWLNAHSNYQSSVNATSSRWVNTLLNGGDIWVAEGGQADFTSDVVRHIKNTNPGINTNNRIHVVQHSLWNEQQSDQGDLNYARANTDYIRIADGNGVNATADLNQKSASFVALARASQHGAAWNAAFQYLNPDNKLDFSDTVELLHILGIGKDRIATVNDFGAVFLDQAPTVEPDSPTPWSDSYSVGNQCYCDTNFDHGLGALSVDTAAGRRSIREVCTAITNRFGNGSFQNRVYYNTVQCGHGPANNAPDETVCPGIPRGNDDYTGSRCQQTGATWNLDLLFTAPEPEPTPAPAPQPEPAPEPEPAPVPAPAPIIDFPVCSASVVDDNGDGFGWENNQSCLIQTTSAPPAATPPAATPAPVAPVAPIDNPLVNFPVCSAGIPDNGDGYGWENNQTCVIAVNSAPTPVATPPAATQPPSAPVAPIDNPLVNFPVCSAGIPDNGDGYGWENNQTCVIQVNSTAAPVATPPATQTPSAPVAPIDNPLVNFPVCSASIVDDNGDGYGWENNQTCVIQQGNSAPRATTPPPAAPVAPVNNPLVNFPVCSADIPDNGDGYGWENNQTCVIAVNSTAAPSVTTPAAPVAPVNNPLVNFPVCSAGIPDNGDGYGWENNQTCVIPANTAATPLAPIDNPLVNFPVCSAGIPDNGDGYGWENNQTCVIPARG